MIWKHRILLPLLAALVLLLAACSGGGTAPVQTTAAFSLAEETTAAEENAQVTAPAAEETAGETSQESAEEAPEATEEETAAETEPETEAETAAPETTAEAEEAALTVQEDGEYNTRDEVAAYIHAFGHLPSNYISKRDAEDLGWPGGSLEPYAPGKSIGGSRFGNYEGLLPEAKGRKYYECDIDTRGKKKRGAKRIVYSNDGLIYYTEDHYESFELLYGEE
ncbi:MAG: ribonuclease [Lachnospiraceae bacterium]|nr:ribonuclease [Lachnospiraceae bacterium]